MDRRKRFAAFILPLFVILLTLGNYSRLTGTENIRAIHIITLLTMGMVIGILLRNIFEYIIRRRNSNL